MIVFSELISRAAVSGQSLPIRLEGAIKNLIFDSSLQIRACLPPSDFPSYFRMTSGHFAIAPPRPQPFLPPLSTPPKEQQGTGEKKWNSSSCFLTMVLWSRRVLHLETNLQASQVRIPEVPTS